MATVVERTVDIEATTGDVWRVLADDFADAADRNSLMKYSAPNPAAEVPAGSTVVGRVFRARGLGTVTEVITEFDRDTMRLSYRPDKPSAVRDLSNSWSLTEMAPDLARVTMTARFDMRGFRATGDTAPEVPTRTVRRHDAHRSTDLRRNRPTFTSQAEGH